MNKTIKVISALLIALLLIATLSQVSLATNYKEMISDVNQKADSSDIDTSEITGKIGDIIRVIRNIAAVGSVLILSILGIKYMIGSTEERAEYKKSFMPLIIGVIVVVGASWIASAIFSVAG